MARGSNLAALNAGIKRAKALVSEGDTCISKADKEGQTRLQGQATEQIPSTGPGSNNRLRGGVNGGGIVPPGGGTTNTIPPGGGQDTFGGGTTNTIPPGGGHNVRWRHDRHGSGRPMRDSRAVGCFTQRLSGT